MKGISLCAECAYYSMKKHKCTRGCTVDPDVSKGENPSFYVDCPLPEVEEKRLIPCSERLPEKSGLYLTYQKELGRFQLMRYSPVLRNGTGWFDDNYGLYVTHWMPLPEPPKNEQK